MEDIRAPVDKDLAKQDYLKGMKYKDIAEKYGVTINTVKSWKQRYKWDRKGVHTKEKGCTQKNIKEDTFRMKPDAEVIAEMENTELTEMQRLFCLYYIKSFNATLAAKKAGYAPDSAHAEGSRLLKNVKVATEIRRIKGQMTEELFLDAMDVLDRYIKIAFSDISDYVTFGQKEEKVMGMFGPIEIKDPITGKKKQLTQIVNYVDLKDSINVDGSIITEVAQGKDGVKIKLADKMKALNKLAEYFDLFPDKVKRRIEEEKLKLALRKAGDSDDEEAADDGFIDALNAEAGEVWNDEED